MLPNSKRLTKSDFIGLRARVSYRGTYFDMATAPAKDTKYACIISKKRIRRAVDRNKARRKFYEALKSAEPSSPLTVLIYPVKQSIHVAVKTIEAELRSVFATL